MSIVHDMDEDDGVIECTDACFMSLQARLMNVIGIICTVFVG